MVERAGGRPDEEGGLFLPPGFRFHPTDEEVITSYLVQKLRNPSFTCRAVADVDLNKCEPRDLPSKAKMGEKEWYFFCHKDMKYPTGTRANRATKEGYWKATGKDREILAAAAGGALVGMRKTLVFYMGRAPRGSKTSWVMHEFRVHGKPRDDSTNLRVNPKDEWVVCKVFNKGEAKSSSTTAKGAAVESSAATTPNVSSVDAGEGVDVDDFLDFVLDHDYFDGYASSLPENIAIDAGCSIPTASGSMGKDDPQLSAMAKALGVNLVGANPGMSMGLPGRPAMAGASKLDYLAPAGAAATPGSILENFGNRPW